ncbi:hypothetical protein D6Z43_13780 [Pseudomonas sp. DY-1]|uniref:hypothetical protein n=1 Tax=Pseudomonas sp. DY-1 TaxID=1755504 RepID=UPI000EA9C27C|nr:hypothetical protein [Pseudomonas sp. DY-1]AYF88165.1 hypothetical protein D6Z43_13780 [Pseudomonas sp. DY-1]
MRWVMLPFSNGTIMKLTSDHKTAQMLTRAKQGVLESTRWLSATEIEGLCGVHGKGATDQTSGWLRDGKIFSIHHDGGDYFPSYALDELDGYRPIKAMSDVLRAFGPTKDSWGVACWFVSVNSYLGGKRPQDLLTTHPDQVVAAAYDELQGIPHG